MRSIVRGTGGDVVRVRQAFGNTTLSAGADVSGECATTESSTNIDWGSCLEDDPYSVFNIIHEFGHVLQFRNDEVYPSALSSDAPTTGEYERLRETWDRMLILKQGHARYDEGLFEDVQAGFATFGRQNTGQGGRNSDEEVADMFLFWIDPSLTFDRSPAGQLRLQFVDGFSTDNFEGSRYPLTCLGMSNWVDGAIQSGLANQEASVLPFRISVSLSLKSQIPNVQCLDLPFSNLDERQFAL
jgi:hypothetical protein